MKISTMVAGVVVLGGVALGGSILTGINEKDVKDVHSKIEKVNNVETKKEDVKNDETNIPEKELDNKNKTNKEIKNEEKHSNLNKHTVDTKDDVKISTGSQQIKKDKIVKEEPKKEVIVEKPNVEIKDNTSVEENEEVSKTCYYCEHSNDIDTFDMGSKYAYENFGLITDDEIRDKVYELPESVCDVHKQNVKDGVEHALQLMHNSEQQTVVNGGEHK